MTGTNVDCDKRLLQFEKPWELKYFDGHGGLTEQVTFDELLLKQVINRESGPSLCVKREPQCLVATAREARMPNFEAACRELAGQGWPVVVRCTGGSCVPQGPGVLNLSMIHRKVRGWRLEDGYLLLCDLLTRLLASYGLDVNTGEVKGAFCDGRYNLQIGGQKIVGTAQRWAGGSREDASVLAHACLLVDMDLFEATEKINLLYRLCGNSQQFTPDACTTISNCLGEKEQLSREALIADVEHRMANLIKTYFNIQG